jgi:hypothetical protein
MKHYKILGSVPPEFINFFLNKVNERKTDQSYQWIQFDDELLTYFLKYFENTELTVQRSFDHSHPIQKVFYSAPGHGFRIHKDGIRCKSALNIALSSNPSDWVRWYDDTHINDLTTTVEYNNLNGTLNNAPRGLSRDTQIYEYENVKYIDQFSPQIGQVYTIDVDTFHSFKCNGPLPRIILQTKFENFPSFEYITESLNNKSFSNIIKNK